MKKGVYLIPNSITLMGTTCGFYSIISTLNQNWEHAAWAILLATIFDALDGWVARLTNSASKFGVQLDSLSDLLTFCVAPAILLYSWKLHDCVYHLQGRETAVRLGWAVTLFFVLCGAMRLARFNVQSDTVESRSFTGMPTPGAAVCMASGVLVFMKYEIDFTGMIYVLAGLMFLMDILMVSNIRYVSAKDYLMMKRKPFWMLVLLAAIVGLIVVDPPVMLFTTSLVYVASGLIDEAVRLVRHKPRQNAQPQPPQPRRAA
ncbi:MAG: CDP-diacylglycerol--serine O-phosphatidyltransferase [bacterium]